jgi:Abnormal spindle-like microcephaly-assoc'd, ASPM-SPD-2-Hydin
MGKVKVGATSKPNKVTIQNGSDTTPVTFTSIAATGDFAMVNGCGATLRPKGKCEVTVRFTPTELGASFGVLTIKSNANNPEAVVNLSGTGTEPKR